MSVDQELNQIFDEFADGLFQAEFVGPVKNAQSPFLPNAESSPL